MFMPARSRLLVDIHFLWSNSRFLVDEAKSVENLGFGDGYCADTL